ncbi:hypothetical protein [Antarctobacter jejuensis]|uniref:hypothetical protein n=1 Tax=Antarctobacter jejuensis TaxID=1439938 RepID=UPI003FD45167
MGSETARVIAQDFLDRQGEATISGDVEATLAWCDLPCTLDSMEGRTVVTTEAEMRAICMSFIQNLKSRQFSHMVRRCLEASFKDEETIWATYETRYVSAGGFRAEEPYVSFVILKHRQDRWKISTMQFAVTGDNPVNATLEQVRTTRDVS